MGSRSVTCRCHPTQVITPALTPARQADTWFTHPGGMEGWIELGDWMHTEMIYLPTDGHPSTYKADQESNSQPVDHRSDPLPTKPVKW